MVVSCQVKLISIFFFLIILFTPAFCRADAQLITDEELDTIVASNLPINLTDSMTNELLEKTLTNPLASLETILNSDLFSSGLTHVNADNSTVVIQTNIAFFIQAITGDIHQSNTAFIAN